VATWDTPIWASDCSTVEPTRDDQVDGRFIYHQLKAMEPRIQATLRRGAAQPHVYARDIQDLEVAVPPVEEQRRIAAILDAADALRANRRQAIAKLDTLTQAIFIEMFGDPAQNSMGWPTAELADVVCGGTTVTYGIVQAGPEFEGGVPYIRTGDIVNGEIAEADLRHTNPKIAGRFPRSRIRTGEIVMSIRATVGTTAVVPETLDGANLTQGTARIAPGTRTTAAFLLHFLRSNSTQRWLQRQVKGATFREITLSRLREMPIQLPPLDLQQNFAVVCSAVGDARGKHRLAHKRTCVLFQSLQQRAFRGEL
jgi:type I restriction enzyme S subunit